MKTPICDFLKQYAQTDVLRLHMPGHKGRGKLGVEQYDITEVSGADSLYEAAGIIRQSEENASKLFGCPTFYSAEGSSLAIRAMVYLAMRHARANGRQPKIAAGRYRLQSFHPESVLLPVKMQKETQAHPSDPHCPYFSYPDRHILLFLP